MGHLNQTRANVRSTKPKRVPLPVATAAELARLRGKKEQDVYIEVVDTWTLKNTVYSDQTGKFPTRARSGNRYIMVMEDSDAGPILAVAIRSRQKEHLLEGFIEMHDTLKKAGINPVLHRIDNEFSKELIEEIE